MTDAPPKLTPAQIGGAVFTALAVPWAGSYVGSFTGTAGTVTGTAVGSILPIVAGWVFLRGVYHAKRLPWQKARQKTRPWHIAVAAPVVAVTVFAVSMAGLSGVEAKVLHRSLSAATTGSRDRGTTLGTVLDAHPASPAPTVLEPSAAPSGSVSPATAAPSPTIPASVTAGPDASASPSPTPPGTIPGVAPSPAVTATQQQGAQQ